MVVGACSHAIQRHDLAVVKWQFLIFLAAFFLIGVGNGISQGVPFPPEPDGPRRLFSDAAKASILTCSPGRELYSAFGHTAIRVTDLAADPPLDKVFNYGTFQFGEGFYVRFVQGELIYSLSTSTYGGFLDNYIRSGRGIKEQRLDLGPEDIAELYAYLQANAHPEHKDYRYLFLYDNCATRIITVLEAVFGPRLTVDCEDRRDSTYRDLLRAKLGGVPLTRFGIDVILGLPVDANLGRCGDAFLPDHLAVEMASMTMDAHSMEERPLVRSTETVLPSMLPPAADRAGWPVTAGWIVLALCLLEWAMGKRWIRRVLPFLTGLVGALLAFLWFGTDHMDTRFNLNLLWAFPLHLLGPGLGAKSPMWRRQLARCMGMAAAAAALMSLAPQYVSQQAFHPAVQPLGLAILICFEPWKRPAKP